MTDYKRKMINILFVLFAAGFNAFAQDAAADEDDYADFGQDTKGLTVTGTPETTQKMEVITKEQIETRNPQDLTTLLEDELNMSIVRFGGYGNQTEMNLRGFDTERIAILIDGVPANSPRSGDFDVTQIDINNIERVEVIYGGSDTKYNVFGALGGIINIITVKKQKPGLSLGVTLSNTVYLPGKYVARHANGKTGGPDYRDLADMQTLSFFAGAGSEKFSWKTSVFGNRAGNHYLYRDDYGFARRKVSNEMLDTGGEVSLVWDLSKTTTLLSSTKTYYANKNFPITANSTGSAISKDFSVTENLMLNAPVIFRDDISTEASITYQYSDTRYGADIKSFDNYITGINRWAWYLNNKITLRTGADWRFLYIDSESASGTDPIKTGNQGGIYITAEWTPYENKKEWRKFMLNASVKGVTDTKQVVAVPKIGWRWQINDMFTLKNNYFRSFKFPDFDDLYYRSLDNIFAGNPNLKPEDGIGSDIMSEFTLNEKFSINSSGFVQWTEDSIHWVKSRGGRWSPENVGKAFFAGVDIHPALTLPIKRAGFDNIKLSASYQYQLSQLLSGDAGFENNYRIPYMPAHIAGGSVDLCWKTGSLLLNVHYESRRFADTMNEMPLDPYCMVNATFNQNTGKHFTVFASLRNILNARYESFAAYYMPGISFTLGVRTKWSVENNEQRPEAER